LNNRQTWVLDDAILLQTLSERYKKMTKTKRIEIEIETHEIKVITFRKNWPRAFCRNCGESVSVIDPEQAAEILNISMQELHRLLEARKVHFVSDGFSLICGRSTGEGQNKNPRKGEARR